MNKEILARLKKKLKKKKQVGEESRAGVGGIEHKVKKKKKSRGEKGREVESQGKEQTEGEGRERRPIWLMNQR